MGIISGICVTNLPFGISEEELRTELLQIYRNEFEDTHNKGKLKIKVFLPVGKKTKAVVSGFSGDFDQMVLIAQKNNIKGRSLVIKKDYGDERDDYGNFILNLPPATRRRRDQLAGESHRKVFKVFKTTFWKELNPNKFDTLTERILYLNTTNFNLDILKSPGHLKFWKSNVEKNSTIVQYRYILETSQAIRFLNKNPRLSNPAPYFTDISSKEISTCSSVKGLGVNGCLLNIEDELRINNGVIPFSSLDAEILNEALTTEIESKCWRCNTHYNLIGIHADLNFVAGVCACQYNSTLDILDKNRAYHWPNESYTRLSPGQKTTQTFIILHYPMKSKYSGTEEYKNIVMPILQEEWKYISRGFKEKNACFGRMSDYAFVEVLINKAGNANDVYAIQVIVPKTKFWATDNIGAIKNATITLQVIEQSNGNYVTTVRKGKVWDMDNQESGTVRLFIQIKLDAHTIPRLGQMVSIVPKLDKSEYVTTKHLIRKWNEQGDKMNELLNVFIDSDASYNWESGMDKIGRKGLYLHTHSNLLTMLRNLNSEQIMAVDKAQRKAMSFIHGPPGTGKTHTAAAIVLTLSTYEKGPILVCTPSNVAADGIAAKITALKMKYGFSTSVLRIFSKTRERNLMKKSGVTSTDPGLECSVLHVEVQKYTRLIKDEQVQEIFKKICQGKQFLLTKAEREIFQEHVQKIESDVMLKFDVFVCTLGALADKRVENWNKQRKIPTVIVDEIGQVTQPSSLSPFLLNPRRIIFAGDHMQLKPTIMSYSAEIAGLDRSLMEWISHNRCHLPWTMLCEQHRMAPVIRKVVSSVTYENTLRDAPNILTRNIDIPKSIYNAVPELLTSPLVVFDDPALETPMGTSYKNEGHANRIVRLVEQMLTEGVPACKITILSLYEAQKETIKCKLDSLGKLTEDISVHNVDGFQGRENSVIILSFVRSNPKGSMGFTAVSNRLNVAISRAKFFLLIVCNLETLKMYEKQAWKIFTKNLMESAMFVR